MIEGSDKNELKLRQRSKYRVEMCYEWKNIHNVVRIALAEFNTESLGTVQRFGVIFLSVPDRMSCGVELFRSLFLSDSFILFSLSLPPSNPFHISLSPMKEGRKSPVLTVATMMSALTIEPNGWPQSKENGIIDNIHIFVHHLWWVTCTQISEEVAGEKNKIVPVEIEGKMLSSERVLRLMHWCYRFTILPGINSSIGVYITLSQVQVRFSRGCSVYVSRDVGETHDFSWFLFLRSGETVESDISFSNPPSPAFVP